MSDVNWRAAVAEGIAVFFFVFIGTGAVVMTGTLDAGLDSSRLIAIAIAHGIGIAVAVAAVGHISGGHINPAVTFAAWVTGRIKAMDAVAYVVAQLVGATLAALVIGGVVVGAIGDGAGTLGSHGLGTNGAGDAVEAWEGLVIELVMTAALVFVFFGAMMDKRGLGHVAPIAVGFTVLIIYLIGWPLTGASVNPARSFGPALVAGAWSDHWIYWVGPIAGAVLAGTGYKYLFQNNKNDE